MDGEDLFQSAKTISDLSVAGVRGGVVIGLRNALDALERWPVAEAIKFIREQIAEREKVG